ncbi:hypothetical protein E2C01_031112 [Portunus trituberculatus]|uniref:Uncharacterized protein n=1 Tax=Portunus trituberculatus TaxID=210409 RepID=A0A5B7EW10_PORTR|nr:hypothetical protein [Portunus trituberculatus]
MVREEPGGVEECLGGYGDCRLVREAVMPPSLFAEERWHISIVFLFIGVSAPTTFAAKVLGDCILLFTRQNCFSDRL